jgi:moderate conductance mechanosensitive channel
MPADRCRARPTRIGSSAARSRGARRPIDPGTAAGLAGRCLRVWLAALLIVTGTAAGALAAKPGLPKPAAAKEEGPPAQVRALLILLADPAVQKWLEKEGAAIGPPTKAASHPSGMMMMSSGLARVRRHIMALVAAVPNLPAEYSQAFERRQTELAGHGRFAVARLLLLFIALGFGAEALFRRATTRIRRRLDGLPVGSVAERLRLIGERFVFAAGVVGAFAVGSVGAFLAFDWPPLLRAIVFGFLLAIVVIRIAAVLGHFLLAPNYEKFRIVPMDDQAARFWSRRLRWFTGWFALGFVYVELLGTLGFSLPERQLVAYALGLGLLAIALETIWRRPVPVAAVAEAVAETRHLGRHSQNVLLTVGAVLLWVLWVAGAQASFWLLLVVMVLPLASAATRRAVDHLLRPPGMPKVDDTVPSVTAVCIERGMRALLLIGAVGVLAWGWGVPVSMMTGEDTVLSRVLHGALSAVVILLVADLIWRASKAAIDKKLAEAADPGLPNTEEARRRARLRTLLPIFRHVLFFLVLAIAAMMALAAIGVQIGPLIAGAGVVGVAIGFGSQTLVRDIIAGMFYLLDDAFRVGEYIQSGNYKGTVESFSIRSVKLRHQRGALYTVPFGLLGAIQNLSRDWVIDKLTIGITYDSDIALARKLIKQIGLELQKVPEFAPLILQPLKMQGVDAFGDYAVQLRMKMMTLPGEQFVIRRQALEMIKKAFDANGIKFAYPTVQMAGGEAEPDTAAIAQQALQLTHPQSQAAE